MTQVFVYGTLKRSLRNHHLLAEAEFKGIAYTVDSYRMYTVGFPVVIPSPDGKTVTGEVYEVDDQTLKRLDNLEAEGHMYDRKLVGIVYPGTDRQMEMVDQAYMYIGNDKYWKDGNRMTPFTDVNSFGELEWRS